MNDEDDTWEDGFGHSIAGALKGLREDTTEQMRVFFIDVLKHSVKFLQSEIENQGKGGGDER